MDHYPLKNIVFFYVLYIIIRDIVKQLYELSRNVTVFENLCSAAAKNEIKIILWKLVSISLLIVVDILCNIRIILTLVVRHAPLEGVASTGSKCVKSGKTYLYSVKFKNLLLTNIKDKFLI